MRDRRIVLKGMLLPCCTSSGIIFLKLEEKQLVNDVVALPLVSFCLSSGEFLQYDLKQNLNKKLSDDVCSYKK